MVNQAASNVSVTINKGFDSVDFFTNDDLSWIVHDSDVVRADYGSIASHPRPDLGQAFFPKDTLPPMNYCLIRAHHEDILGKYQYLNIEHGELRCTEIKFAWASARWHIQKQDSGFAIQNYWKTDQYLYLPTDRQEVACGSMDELNSYKSWLIVPTPEKLFRFHNSSRPAANATMYVNNLDIKRLVLYTVKEGWSSAQWGIIGHRPENLS
jgi:hypothetical protein